MVTISLSSPPSGCERRLARRFAAVETLGSVSMIGSDKTGTLTADQMTVRRIWSPGERSTSPQRLRPQGEFLQNGEPVAASEPLRELLEPPPASTHGRARSDGSTEIRGDPTEAALVVAAAKARTTGRAVAARPASRRSRSRRAEADDHPALTPGGCVAYPRAHPRSAALLHPLASPAGETPQPGRP